MRLPFFVWAQLVTSFLLLLAFPPLEAGRRSPAHGQARRNKLLHCPAGSWSAASPGFIRGAATRSSGSTCFGSLPTRRCSLILPAMGIVAGDHRQQHAETPLGLPAHGLCHGVPGFMSFVVWAHHMFLTGMGTVISSFFQATTMIISIPSIIILTALFLSALGRIDTFHNSHALRSRVPADVRDRGLTGLPLGLAPADIHLHDTYYVTAISTTSLLRGRSSRSLRGCTTGSRR